MALKVKTLTTRKDRPEKIRLYAEIVEYRKHLETKANVLHIETKHESLQHTSLKQYDSIPRLYHIYP